MFIHLFCKWILLCYFSIQSELNFRLPNTFNISCECDFFFIRLWLCICDPCIVLLYYLCVCFSIWQKHAKEKKNNNFSCVHMYLCLCISLTFTIIVLSMVNKRLFINVFAVCVFFFVCYSLKLLWKSIQYLFYLFVLYHQTKLIFAVMREDNFCGKRDAATKLSPWTIQSTLCKH